MPAPDVTQWTDDELEQEMKAWQDGGDNARIAAQWAYRVVAEVERRKTLKS